jgi:hypothetical protein
MHAGLGQESRGDGSILTEEIRGIAKLGKSRVFWIITLVMALLFVMSTVKVAYSAEETGLNEKTTLALTPLTTIDYSLGPSREFDVNVTALNATGLHGFRIVLGYDPRLIVCATVQEGDLLQTSGSKTTFEETIDNEAGNVNASSSIACVCSTEVDGNGTLIMLKFQVVTRGETSIHFQYANIYDPNGTALPCVTYDGYFNNKFLIDIAMSLTLFSVTMASVLLNPKAEGKLKVTFEENEFKVRDAVILVAFMVVMIFSIVFFRALVAPLMILFLFSYSTLLFLFTYLFSKRWYVATVPPALFVLLYVFLRDTSIWSYYLVSIYGVVFAILITLYVGSLFSWKPTVIFVALLTMVDVILVLVTGTMVQAANTAFRGLSLPEMVAVPIVPPIVTPVGWLEMALGLGDFFFAGLLGIQTFKKFGRKIAVMSVLAMTASFFAFETLQLTYWRIPMPGTVMIISGWLPIVLGKVLKDHISTAKQEKPDGKP